MILEQCVEEQDIMKDLWQVQKITLEFLLYENFCRIGKHSILNSANLRMLVTKITTKWMSLQYVISTEATFFKNFIKADPKNNTLS